MANRDVEQGCRHHVAQRLVVHCLGIGDLLALLRELGPFGLAGAFELGDALVEGSEVGRGSRGGRRGLYIVQRARGLLGLRAQIGDVAAQGANGFFPARRSARPSPDRPTGLPALASTAATRPFRASTVALVTCGAAGGACTAGQPSIQPTAITTAAAAAPEIGATTQGDTGADATAACASARSGSTSGLLGFHLLRWSAQPLAGPPSPVAGWRLRSPRGRWWAECAWHGRTRGPILRLQACRRPS